MPPKSEDQDSELKERIARVLFASGYSCRFNVDVVSGLRDMSGDVGEAVQYTDVDVMAQRTDPLLRWSLGIADCKSGRTGSPRERLFWLSGVKDRFEAEFAAFVKQSLEPGPYVSDYRRLGLTVYSSETLATAERMTGASSLEKTGPVQRGSAASWYEAMLPLKTVNKAAFRYLSFGYWADAPGPQVESLVTLIHDLTDSQSAFARISAMSLLSSSVLRIATEVALTGPKRQHQAVLAPFSGQSSPQDLERIMDAVHGFVHAEIEKQTGRKWGVTREAFRTFLAPDYVDHLVDLVGRFLANPGAIDVPRALDVVAFEKHLRQRDPNLGETLGRNSSVEGVCRAVGDVLAFLERAHAVTTEEAKSFRIDSPST